jgi:hypothetical protein
MLSIAVAAGSFGWNTSSGEIFWVRRKLPDFRIRQYAICQSQDGP